MLQSAAVTAGRREGPAPAAVLAGETGEQVGCFRGPVLGQAHCCPDAEELLRACQLLRVKTPAVTFPNPHLLKNVCVPLKR